MKTTTQPIRSLCIKFSFHSLQFVILFLIVLNVKAEVEKLDDKTKRVVYNSKLYTKQNFPFYFSDTTNYFIVLKNNKNCQSCFSIVNDFIKSAKDSLRAKLISITLIDSTTLSRKIQEAANIRLMPDMDRCFYQYKNSNDENLFSQLKINYTPVLLIISRGEIFLIPYLDIFEYQTMEISYVVKNKIFQLLK